MGFDTDPDAQPSLIPRSITMRRAIRVLGLLLLAAGSSSARADGPALQGEWRTSLGVVTFKPRG